MALVAFKTLKDQIASKLVGVGKDRIAIRTQGCWSCIHWDMDKAVKLWWDEARANMLAQGTKIALESPQGENHPKVRSIREMVPKTDASMAAGEWGACSVGKTATGEPVGTNVASTYLCDQWTGKVGASVAREGQAPDKLPEELMDRVMDDGSLKLDDEN